MKGYILTSDGYSESLITEKIATNEKGIKTILKEAIEEYQKKFVNIISIDYENLIITYKYIDWCNDIEIGHYKFRECEII